MIPQIIPALAILLPVRFVPFTPKKLKEKSFKIKKKNTGHIYFD